MMYDNLFSCAVGENITYLLTKFSFSIQIAVHFTKYIYIVFVTGEDDIARFDSRRYN